MSTITPMYRETLEMTKVQLRAEQLRLEQMITSIDAFLSGNGEQPVLSAVPCVDSTHRAKRRKSTTSSIGIADAVYNMLKKTGKAKTPTILAQLSADGRPVSGKRPIQTLYGILHKDANSANPRVARVAGGYWEAVSK